jgi:hypothetical protein
MTPSNVVEVMCGEDGLNELSQVEQEIAIHAWVELVEHMKPGQGTAQMSADETESALRILRTLVDAVKEANNKYPPPKLRVVPS